IASLDPSTAWPDLVTWRFSDLAPHSDVSRLVPIVVLGSTHLPSLRTTQRPTGVSPSHRSTRKPMSAPEMIAGADRLGGCAWARAQTPAMQTVASTRPAATYVRMSPPFSTGARAPPPARTDADASPRIGLSSARHG